MHTRQILPLALAAVTAVAQNNNATLTPLTTALASQPDLSSLLAILGTQPTFLAQLSLAQNVTFLAPSNNAMNDFLNGPDATPANETNAVGVAALLSYHVLNGTFYESEITDQTMLVNTALNLAPYSNITGGQRISFKRQDGNATFFSGLQGISTVTTANVNYTGGTIHVINRVLTLPVNDTRTMVDLNLTAAAGAMRHAGVETRFDRLRDVTMFIPNNEAFNRVGSAFEGNMSTDQLSSIMQYHVVSGSRPLYSSALTNSSLTTLNGAKLTFTNSSGSLFVNSAKILSSNILTNNGVIHIVDNVLNPSNVDARPEPSATTGSPMFSGANQGNSGVPFTSGVATAPGANPTSNPGNGAGGNGGSGGGGGANANPVHNAAPMQTAAVGVAAMLGGLALVANL